MDLGDLKQIEGVLEGTGRTVKKQVVSDSIIDQHMQHIFFIENFHFKGWSHVRILLAIVIQEKSLTLVGAEGFHTAKKESW